MTDSPNIIEVIMKTGEFLLLFTVSLLYPENPSPEDELIAKDGDRCLVADDDDKDDKLSILLF